MSDSNIGVRKEKNIRNHIFIVNSIIHENPRIQLNDMNDLYEAGVKDNIFEANMINEVAVQTPNVLSRSVRGESFKVMCSPHSSPVYRWTPLARSAWRRATTSTFTRTRSLCLPWG